MGAINYRILAFVLSKLMHIENKAQIMIHHFTVNKFI